MNLTVPRSKSERTLVSLIRLLRLRPAADGAKCETAVKRKPAAGTTQGKVRRVFFEMP